MTRRFVAVGLPDSVRSDLRDAVEERAARFSGLSRTWPAGWHVTLAFLGDVADDHAGPVADAVRVALAEHPLPDQLVVGGAGSFGDRVLWCRVDDEPSGALAPLAGAVRSRCARLGIDVDDAPFRAHVTIARARRNRPVRDADVDALAGAIEAVPSARRRWRPAGLEVMASQLGDGPARYVAESSVPA